MDIGKNPTPEAVSLKPATQQEVYTTIGQYDDDPYIVRLLTYTKRKARLHAFLWGFAFGVILTLIFRHFAGSGS